MPVNSEGKNVDYTSNEDIQELLDGDKEDHTVDFTGYLAEIFGYCTTKNGKTFYKAIIINGTKRITLLIWDLSLIKKLYAELISGRILHLDGCYGRLVAPRQNDDLNVIRYDISIMPGTVVTFKEFHVHEATREATKLIPTINFVEIAKAFGEIRVKTYIKTVPAVAVNKSGTLDFGTGSITDVIHKLPVQVGSFKKDEVKHLSKGLCVLVQGDVSRTGNLRLLCKNITHIQVLANEPPLTEDQVTKANKLLKRYDPNSNPGGQTSNKKILRDAVFNLPDNLENQSSANGQTTNGNSG